MDNLQRIEELEQYYTRIAMERECGMRNILTRLENLRSELDMSEERNVFGDREFEHRIKTFDSAYEKLFRKGFDVSEKGLDELHDIAGIRIIVPYRDDVYKIVAMIKKPTSLLKDMLKSEAALKVVEEKDYIKEPKANGYRAYHLLTKMKVYFSDGKARWVPVEIQVMTKAMELWASYEHELKYKNLNPSPDCQKRFKEIADQLVAFEENLMNFRDYNEEEAICNEDNMRHAEAVDIEEMAILAAVCEKATTDVTE